MPNGSPPERAADRRQAFDKWGGGVRLHENDVRPVGGTQDVAGLVLEVDRVGPELHVTVASLRIRGVMVEVEVSVAVHADLLDQDLPDRCRSELGLAVGGLRGLLN